MLIEETGKISPFYCKKSNQQRHRSAQWDRLNVAGARLWFSGPFGRLDFRGDVYARFIGRFVRDRN